MRCALPSLLLASLAIACSSGTSNGGSDATGVDSIVGGVHESRFPAIGYMLHGTSRESLAGPNCGVTLIAPRVAVTAAHCLVLQRQKNPAFVFGVSFGEVGSSTVYPASVARSHPGFSLGGSPRYSHDIAVMILERPVEGIAPVAIAAMPAGTTARYVGYGRTTPGGYNEHSGYTNERKGTAQSIVELSQSRIYTEGVDGGLCWGDSGGPLFDEQTGAIFGVLSDFATEPLTCAVGNKMIFTDLTTEAAFLQTALACAVDPDADATKCMGGSGLPPPNTCTYPCGVHGYAEDECKPANGKQWLCKDGCIREVASCGPSGVPSCHYSCAAHGYSAGECRTNASGAWSCNANGCVTQVVSCANRVCKYPCVAHGYAEHECRLNGSGSWLCENGCIAQVASCTP